MLGLMFIKNPFTPEGQRYWIARCLNDYPFEKEHITNIENLRRRKGEDVKYEEAQNNKDNFYKHLRWITFGYHHDWDTKVDISACDIFHCGRLIFSSVIFGF